MNSDKFIFVSVKNQKLYCYSSKRLLGSYQVSTSKNGLGELRNSECTPRGWHKIHAVIGKGAAINSVFVARELTGEIYGPLLSCQFPHRDWILTRIIQLAGLEKGRNQDGQVDTLSRYIYLHGIPETTDIAVPGSHGCIRMHNRDLVKLAKWVTVGALVCIE